MNTTAPCQLENVCGDMEGGSWMCGLDTHLLGALQPPGAPHKNSSSWLGAGTHRSPRGAVSSTSQQGARGWGTTNLSGLKEFGRNPTEYALSPPDTSN